MAPGSLHLHLRFLSACLAVGLAESITILSQAWSASAPHSWARSRATGKKAALGTSIFFLKYSTHTLVVHSKFTRNSQARLKKCEFPQVRKLLSNRAIDVPCFQIPLDPLAGTGSGSDSTFNRPPLARTQAETIGWFDA